MTAALSPVLDRFSREYLAYHDISEGRRREVLRHLGVLEVRAGVPIQDVTADVVRAYVAELGETRSPTTVGKILNQIRPFFQWAWEAGVVDAQHLMEVKAVRPPRGSRAAGKPRPYSRTEIQQLWGDWERKYALPADLERAHWYLRRWENGTSRWGRVRPLAWRLQSRAIICLGMSGGLRRDEIYNLSVAEMHYENEYVVAGSRKNMAGEMIYRPVPWTTPQMQEAVQDWLDLRARIQPGHERPWLSMASTPHIRTPLPHRKFEGLMTNLGRGWEFHRLRHTAATEMLRSGYPLETVQKVMGHAKLQQTLVYAELLTEDVVRVAGKCSMQLSTALAALEAA